MMTGQKKDLSDKSIAKLLSEHPGEAYDDLIREKNAAFFYHLSSLRRSLLLWFPFDRTGSVLEIGGGFGALTGFLSERFGHVDVLEPDPLRAESLQTRYPDKHNIRIFRKTIDQFDTAEKYDAVIYTDLSKNGNSSLSVLPDKLSSLIHEDGVALLGFCSRFGAKYQCGGLDQHVTIPFSTDSLYSKNEVKEALEPSFTYVKWYYPMPDERFVQAVYTDRSDFRTLSDRVFCFDGYNSPFIEDEKQMLLRYVRGEMITEHVNYCLAELRKKEYKDPICEVYLSADREEGRRFMVTVMEDTVEKAPLDEQSSLALEAAHRNLQHLKDRGIRVVEERHCDGKIIMPRIKGENLLSHLSLVTSREEVFSLFDRIYGSILISSEHDENNVLKTGYIDMIPFNIFWNGGELLYYDQEFTIPNCDASYIMFRALNYSWEHVPELSNIVPLDEMKSRYSITEEKWSEYKQTETDFVGKNRSFGTYPQLYRWNYLPETAVHANRAALLGYDSAKQQEIRSVELDILSHFMRFCKEHDLPWFALHGTLLGAVRHSGFIPWDNDIDIGMRREDFDRLTSLFDNSSAQPYFLQTMWNEYWAFHGGYARLQRLDTAQIGPADCYRPGHYGIGIDIFPLDYCEEDPVKFLRKQKRITHLQRLIYAKLYPLKTGKISDADGSLVSLYYLVRHLIPMRVLKSLLKRCFREKKHSSRRAILSCYYKDGINRNIYDDRDTKNLSELPFEDLEIPVIGNAEHYLAKRYGENYMDIPGSRKIKNDGTMYDAHKSYVDYRGW